MVTEIYRYKFDESVAPEDIEAALVLAIWSSEALHGEAQTRLDAAHFLDCETRTCIIDAGTAVGRDFCRLFLTFVRRECGDDSFQVDRVQSTAVAAAQK